MIGTICLGAVTKIDNVELPLHAEFLTILFGLEVARRNSFLSMIVESDSLLAIQEILKHKGFFCEWQCLISDIISLSLEYNYYKFSHIRRSTNGCAHNIVHLSCELGI